MSPGVAHQELKLSPPGVDHTLLNIALVTASNIIVLCAL
jgi:hypothetical protein